MNIKVNWNTGASEVMNIDRASRLIALMTPLSVYSINQHFRRGNTINTPLGEFAVEDTK